MKDECLPKGFWIAYQKKIPLVMKGKKTITHQNKM
jgi:hypothetical protein